MIGDDGKRLNPDLFVDINEREHWSRAMRAGDFATHRATRSSKTPGKVNRGVIYAARVGQIICGLCGQIRLNLGGPHAPRFNDANQRVDCVGNPLGGTAA